MKISERCFQFVELRFLIHKTSMKPFVARLDTTLSLEVKLPEHCLISLLFKVDHQVRRSFHLEPNTSVKHKMMFREYWKKIIDQEENQTELASMDAVSCFADAKLDRIYIKDDSNEDLNQVD